MSSKFSHFIHCIISLVEESASKTTHEPYVTRWSELNLWLFGYKYRMTFLKEHWTWIFKKLKLYTASNYIIQRNWTLTFLSKMHQLPRYKCTAMVLWSYLHFLTFHKSHCKFSPLYPFSFSFYHSWGCWLFQGCEFGVCLSCCPAENCIWLLSDSQLGSCLYAPPPPFFLLPILPLISSQFSMCDSD